MQFNKEQAEALAHDKGPLLIIAGAGTGKTRVITSKIVELINSGKVQPYEILALTFTEKAANEMIERVDESMPLGYEELCIKTFHSFSEKLLRESGLEIGIDPGFKILGEVEQWFFFKKNLFAFDLDYYRPLGNPNRFISDLLGHFGKLKDELVTPEKYIEYAKGLDGEEHDKMLEIANAYKTYRKLLIKNNYLDFGDLTYYAIELLSKRESVLKKYQDFYKYILVDEFQDTNYSQFKLVTLLAMSHKNIVVVGDDDQSIYKWRGASLSNILKFDESFPKHEKIVLLENYRSSKNILDASYQLIQNNNPDRLEVKSGLSKKLKCNNSHNEPVEIHHFPDFISETSFVVEKIKFLHQNDNVPFENFAILVRSNKLANPFIDELKALGIPYQVRNPKGLLSLEEIKDFVAIIRFLANPYGNISLLRILKMDVFGVQMSEILDLLKKANKGYLFDALKVATSSENMTIPGTESGFKKILNILSELIEFSKHNCVGAVLNEFLLKSDYLNFLVENEKYEEMENINEFAKQISRFEKENVDNSVIDFSSYMDLLEESNSALNYDEFKDRESVQILTAHGAKGLEFEYVFIVNVVNQRFPMSKRSDAFALPNEITNEIYPEGDFHLQEERRLFYVAMTRAERKLFITFSNQYEGNKKWKISPFISEISDIESTIRVDHEETESAIEKLKNFKKPAKTIFKLPPFSGKKLSYSQIDTFKSCPLKYNFRYLMKAPVPPSHAASFGISVHSTLNDFYQLLKNGADVDFEIMKNLYEKNWMPYGYDSMEHESVRKEKGLIVLKKFYDSNSDPFVVPAFLERPFNIKIGEYLINGRIDRIDKLEDGTFEVIDYKTGQLKKDLKIDKDLQLSIYALACRDVLRIPVSKLSLYFLEDNEKISTTRNDSQLSALCSEIEKNIEELKNSQFPPTPGFQCQFCDFRLICPAV